MRVLGELEVVIEDDCKVEVLLWDERAAESELKEDVVNTLEVVMEDELI